MSVQDARRRDGTRSVTSSYRADRGQLVDRVLELLTVHTDVGNDVMYPEVRAALPELEDDVLESYEEHHVADGLAMELAAMPPDAERFEAQTTVLIENVMYHIKEEERTGFRRCASGWAASGCSSSVRSCWRRSSVRRVRRLGPACRRRPSTPLCPDTNPRFAMFGGTERLRSLDEFVSHRGG
jgi:hypothetical protein